MFHWRCVSSQQLDAVIKYLRIQAPIFHGPDGAHQHAVHLLATVGDAGQADDRPLGSGGSNSLINHFWMSLNPVQNRSQQGVNINQLAATDFVQLPVRNLVVEMHHAVTIAGHLP